jgi:hypothetical protein
MAVDKLTQSTAINEHPISLEPAQTTVDDNDQQDGVRVAEAVTATWSKKSLVIVYTW